MRKQVLFRCAIMLCAICALAMLAPQVGVAEKDAPSPQIQAYLGAAFTYQGVLRDAGKPANGNYDLQFTLYNVATNGSPLPGTIPLLHTNVPVAQGIFTVQLDFGYIYGNQQLYLEIGVRPGGSSDDFTILTPRQTITPAPQANYALTAGIAKDTQSVDWNAVYNKPANLSWRRIYVPANAMNYTTGLNITMHEKGLRWPNTSQLAGFGVSKPTDWKGTTPIKVTIYFALYQTTAPGFCQWRLQTSGSMLNLPVENPSPGWDTMSYNNPEDAHLLAYGNAVGRLFLMKSQTWVSKWSEFHETWYFSSGVNTGTALNSNDMWFFYFQRGCSVPNNETYTGDMYVVGAEVSYLAAP